MPRKSDARWRGVRVVFSRVPQGSYLSAGKEYGVESAERRSIYFWSDATKSGTSDSRIMLDTSEFTILG